MFEDACFICGSSAGGRLYCSEACKNRDARPTAAIRSSRAHSNAGSVYDSDLLSEDSDIPPLVHSASRPGQAPSAHSLSSSPTSSVMSTLSIADDPTATLTQDSSFFRLPYGPASPSTEANKLDVGPGLAQPPPLSLNPPSPAAQLARPQELRYARKPSSSNVQRGTPLTMLHRRTPSTGNMNSHVSSVAINTPLPPSPEPSPVLAAQDAPDSATLRRRQPSVPSSQTSSSSTRSKNFRISLPAYFSLLEPIKVEHPQRSHRSPSRSSSPSRTRSSAVEYRRVAVDREPGTPSNRKALPRSSSTPRANDRHYNAMATTTITMTSGPFSVTPKPHQILNGGHPSPHSPDSCSPRSSSRNHRQHTSCMTPTPRGRSRRRPSDVHSRLNESHGHHRFHEHPTRSRSHSIGHRRTTTQSSGSGEDQKMEATIRGRLHLRHSTHQPLVLNATSVSVRSALFLGTLRSQHRQPAAFPHTPSSISPLTSTRFPGGHAKSRSSDELKPADDHPYYTHERLNAVESSPEEERGRGRGRPRTNRSISDTS